MTEPEPKRRDHSAAISCLPIVVLWTVLGLYFFADRIWGETPPILKWAVIGFGCLVLLGLLGALVSGKRDTKVGALIGLAIIAVGVVFLPPREDRKAAATADELVRELAERGEAVEHQADALPAITDQTTQAELDQHLGRVMDQVREQAESSEELMGRATEVLPRAPADKRERLAQAIHEYYQRSRRTNEKREQWIQQVRARVEALKKKATGPK